MYSNKKEYTEDKFHAKIHFNTPIDAKGCEFLAGLNEMKQYQAELGIFTGVFSIHPSPRHLNHSSLMYRCSRLHITSLRF